MVKRALVVPEKKSLNIFYRSQFPNLTFENILLYDFLFFLYNTKSDEVSSPSLEKSFRGYHHLKINIAKLAFSTDLKSTVPVTALSQVIFFETWAATTGKAAVQTLFCDWQMEKLPYPVINAEF